MPDCSAILLAAGRSRRLGFDKVLTPLGGKPAVCHSLETLASSPAIARITLVTRPDIEGQIADLAGKIVTAKPWKIVHGGVERQDSVAAGLAQSGDEPYVLIHDSARVLLTQSIIDQVLDAARKTGGAVAASKATDTIKQSTPEGIVEKTLDRSKLWTIQTPQIFRRDLICRAMENAEVKKIAMTDDASALEALGLPVQCVDVAQLNLKITRENDWGLLELWLGMEDLSAIRRLLHDVSNLTNPLIGYIPLLEKHRGSEEKFQNYLATVKTSASALQETLKKLQILSQKSLPKENPEKHA